MEALLPLAGPPARPLVVIVDDESSVRRALGRLLRSADFEVDTFESGLEFLDSLRRRTPHCVILDLHMPRLDGFEVLERLAAQPAHVPVLVITAHDTEETRQRARRAGARAYLSKPVNDQSLLDAIHGCVGIGPSP